MKKCRIIKKTMAWVSMVSFLIAATGCGRKELSYEDYDTSRSDVEVSDYENVTDTTNGGTLKEKLGVGEEWHWSEDIGTGKEVVEVAADLVIPEVPQMYTMEVEKYYYTPEDKKRILDYFLDPYSVKVDLDNDRLPTKEHILEEIALLEDTLEELKQDGEDTTSYITTQIDTLKSQLAEAPDASDVSVDVGDYSQNFYIGTRDQVPFSVAFQMDEKNNDSSWTLRAKDLSRFNSQGRDDIIPRTNGMLLSKNLCSLSSEEAMKQAEKICEELGIAHMKAVWIGDLLWDLGQAEPEYNGYEITLTRDINGVFVDNGLYFADNEDAANMRQHFYDAESVVIDINDAGICYMCYKGILTKGAIGNAVKLLSYEQVKNVYRELLKAHGKEYNIAYFSCMELNYVRVANDENTNIYCYIPAWRLGTPERTSYNNIESLSQNIWINAMDGTVIDMEKEGNAVYFFDYR